MGRKCAVPHCYTGYRKCKEKASLYRVPDDDFFLNKWQEAIAREDRPITPKDYVCEKHFKDDDILRRRIIKDVVEEYQRPRLKPDAIPSIFPDLPEFILKMVKKRRKMPIENGATDDSLDISKTNDKTENVNVGGNFMPNEIKVEPLETTETQVVTENSVEPILNNEIDIKSEPDEIVDHSMDHDGSSEKEDPTFGPRMHRCDQCDYQTKYLHNLRTHKTKHLTGEEAYLHCKHCPNFKTKWELTYRNHLKIKHGLGKQEVFRCTLCQFETKVKLCLKRHYERHNRGVFEKKFPCVFSRCDFREKSKVLLDTHMLSHIPNNTNKKSTTEKSKAFKCTECLYETNSKTHIIKHIKSAHSSGDDTVVSVNGKKSMSTLEPANDGLSYITETELKEKPVYKCIKCSYKSSSQACLLKHVFKHKYPKSRSQKNSQKDATKTNVWKCPKCPYATFFQHALQRHQESECERTYNCTDCNFKANSKSDCIKHTLTHRNISIEFLNQNETVSGEVEKLCVESDIEKNDEIKSKNEESMIQDPVKESSRILGVAEEAESQDEVGSNTLPAQNAEQRKGDVDSNKLHEFLLVNVKEEIHPFDNVV